MGISGQGRRPGAAPVIQSHLMEGTCGVCGVFVFNFSFLSDLKSEIDKLATEYISNARTLSSEEKLGLLKQIQEAYGKCKEFGDDKVQLAMQTYEMV